MVSLSAIVMGEVWKKLKKRMMRVIPKIVKTEILIQKTKSLVIELRN